MSDQEAPKIGQYLLGELPPEEMDALEARLLTESGLFELAEAVEDDVVDRYVRGELSPVEAKRFERRLLPSERIRERVAFARALAERGAKPAGRPLPAAPPVRTPAPVVPLFRAPARLAWAATLIACLAAGALGFEVYQLRDRAGDLERDRAAAVARLEQGRRVKAPPALGEEARERDPEAERLAAELFDARERIAALEAQEAAQTARRVRSSGKVEDDPKTVRLFVPLSTRSGGEPEKVRLDDAERVELQLDLGGYRPAGSVVVTISRQGQPVWRQLQVPVEALEGESMALVELPRESLDEGRYRIELAEGETGESPHLLGTYEIFVRR